MMYPAAWSGGCIVLLLGVAGVERAVQIVEGWRANLRTNREITARMNVSLAAARRELTEPPTAPYVAPVLGIRIGDRHPDPVQHQPFPTSYRPAHASPETSATPLDYCGWHWRVDTAELGRFISDHEPSLVESAR
jgi:hypothetical protein